MSEPLTTSSAAAFNFDLCLITGHALRFMGTGPGEYRGAEHN